VVTSASNRAILVS